MKRKLYFIAALTSMSLTNSFAQYPTNGLVEYYSFNDVLTAEIGSTGSDFTPNTSANFASGIYNGTNHRVYSKAGSDNILMTNDNISGFPTINNDFTVCFWLKLNADFTASLFNYIGSQTPGNGGPNSVESADMNGVYMTYDANELFIGKVEMGLFSDFSIPYNYSTSWHHIALVHHSSGVGNDILIDGVSVGAFDQTINFATINHPNSTLRIGASPGGIDYGIFDIDEFLIYDRIVSSGEINTIMTSNSLQLGVDEFASNLITVYPNPTSDQVNVDFPSDRTTSFSVFSTDNREVLSGELSAGQNTINVQDLANGTYFLKTTINGAVVTKKISKQ